ncbi:MAG TPA: RluA family pseudouridine synthase [Chloroflexota bacterium]|nr:RluA family pseudouridine synthase [Chloroflexota bacterium]
MTPLEGSGQTGYDRAERFIVPDSAAGSRLDRFLAEQVPQHSRAVLQRLIESGDVTLDNRSARPSERLRAGQVVQIVILPPAPTGIVPTALPIEVVYENPDLLVLNKPAGLVVHPAPGHAADTLANALMARYPGLAVGNASRPGIVHRLDKGTSGLMVVALSDRAYQDLIAQMKQRTVHKEYLALVHGTVGPERGVVEAPIGRERQDRTKMAVIAGGRAARTTFRVVQRFPAFTLLRLKIETGRTHQIRVHLAAIGHPVVGDLVYGPRQPALGLERPFLHAWHLGFHLPGEEACLVAWAPLPADLRVVLEQLS